MREHSDRPVRVQEISSSINVPQRSLNRAFRDTLDMPPGLYLRNWRLAQVQRSLADPESDVTVTGAALKHGFWELGRFAGQYQKLFGELPSETLRRTQAA